MKDLIDAAQALSLAVLFLAAIAVVVGVVWRFIEKWGK